MFKMKKIQKLLPPPDLRQDSKKLVSAIKNSEKLIAESEKQRNELVSKLQEHVSEIASLLFEVKDLQEVKTELRERIVTKKNETRQYVEKVREQLDMKNCEILKLKYDLRHQSSITRCIENHLKNAQDNLDLRTQTNSELLDNLEQRCERIKELEEIIKKNGYSSAPVTSQGHGNCVNGIQGQGYRTQGQPSRGVSQARRGVLQARRAWRPEYGQRRDRYPKQ